MTYAPRRALLPLLLSSLVLAGCAIKPQPLTVDERKAALAKAQQSIYADQEAVSGPISLEEAMARALKYNLDQRVKLMEEAVTRRQLSMANVDLLPKLTASAGYTNRNNVLASSSENVVTGTQSLVPSTSTDDSLTRADLGLSWNILDFGVSYYTAQQQSDRVLVMQERRRKVVQQLMQQVRQAYWQAVGAQQVEAKLQQVLAQAETALADLQKIERERLLSPLDTLNQQRQLLDVIRQMNAIQDELAQAKPRLAAIMNLAPGSHFTLDAAPADLPAPLLLQNLEALEESALINRPELVEAHYNERISVRETRKAMLKLLPGIEFNAGAHYDSNSYLVNNHWRDVGIRVSWNLINLLNARNIRDTARAQEDVAKSQHLALNMAVLTQVHVAYRDYQGKQRQYELNNRLNGVEQSLLRHTQNQAKLDARGKTEEIRASASALVSELRLFQSYSALQSAYGQVQATLGQDPLPPTVSGHDLKTLQQAVRQAEQDWLQRQALLTKTQKENPLHGT
ncbi:MAG TPA: TolC family protein [Pseudomonas sp.]|nr:TolC family protein [Pseudomonas sp.]